MQVILLERIENLGQMGDTVTVKNGFARNYLLPQQKALRANKENVAYFETQRAQLEAANLKKKKEAEKAAEKISGTELVMIRQASENGQLFGSVRTHDIKEALSEQGISIEKTQIMLSAPIKTIGLFPLRIKLHPEVDAAISVNIAKSDGDAESQRVIDESLVQEVATEEPTAETTHEDTNTEEKVAVEAQAAEASDDSQTSEKESTDEEAA